MRKKLLIKLKGFSLMEILLAITLFSMLIMVVGTLVIESLRSSRNLAQRDSSSYAIKEIFNAITITKNDLWSAIVGNTGGAVKHLTFTNNKYSIVDGVDVENGVSLGLTINYAYRDPNGNIVISGGTQDVHTREITVTATWHDILGQDNSVSSIIYVNDWNTLEWLQTTQAQFNAGTNNQTRVTNVIDGEVQLQQIFYPDWCKPNLSINQYDIPGSAEAKKLFTPAAGTTYLGTGGQTQGQTLTKLNIQGVENPTLTVVGTFNGYTANRIFVSGNYAYLAVSNNNNKQVVILDISHTPYTEVGYFKASRTGSAYAVVVDGNYGYVSIGKYVYSFDLSSKTGKRTQLSSVLLVTQENMGKTGYVSQLIVKNNWLYASLYEDWYELAIVNVSNPSSLQRTSLTSVNDGQAEDIGINSAGTRVYFGTDWVSYEPNFFIVDVSNKTKDDLPVIARYTTTDHMNIVGVAYVENDNRIILVGNGGTQQYQVLNSATERSLTKCGGMSQPYEINDVDSVRDADTNSFSYILTDDPNDEFKILRGGPGAGGGDTGYGYAASGDYTSQVFDTNSTTTNYYYLEWSGLVPATTTAKIQVRTGTTADLSSQPWLGPDGTTGSYFTTQTPTTFPSIFQGKEFVQYKIFMTSDTISTPRIDLIRINYQK
jgi:hypothetical protein